MRRFFLVLLALLLSGLGGPVTRSASSGSRVVTAIEVCRTREGELEYSRYTGQAQLRSILGWLGQSSSARRVVIDPETFRGELCRVRLSMSDGALREYCLLSGHYLKKPEGSWLRVEQADAERFLQLLDTLAGT